MESSTAYSVTMTETVKTCEVEIAKILHTMQRSTPSPPPFKKRKLFPNPQADQNLIQQALPGRPALRRNSLKEIQKQKFPRSTMALVDEATLQCPIPSATTISPAPSQHQELYASNVGISPLLASASFRYLFSIHSLQSRAASVNSFVPQLGEASRSNLLAQLNTNSVLSQTLKNLNTVGSAWAPVVKPIAPQSRDMSCENIPLCQSVGSTEASPSVVQASSPSRKRNAAGVQKGKLCRMDSCNDPAARRTPYCSAHAGPRRCEKEGCNKCAQGRTRYCISHGGGRRCTVEGCTKAARDRKFCAGHGGGRRCSNQQCNKLAVDNTGKCTAHGGGRRCQSSGCPRSAQSNAPFCVRHGGGRECSIGGCKKVSRGRSGCCMLHSRNKSQQKNK